MKNKIKKVEAMHSDFPKIKLTVFSSLAWSTGAVLLFLMSSAGRLEDNRETKWEWVFARQQNKKTERFVCRGKGWQYSWYIHQYTSREAVITIIQLYKGVSPRRSGVNNSNQFLKRHGVKWNCI